MQNRNALVSLACASQNNNPYTVFQEYIKYCLHTHKQDSMMINELIDSVESEFGIKLPYSIAVKCVDSLVNDELARIKDHKIFKNGSFDVSGFDARRREYKRIEIAILTDLIEYVKGFGKQWDEEYAREMLVKVLDRSGLAYDIFFMQNGFPTDSTNCAIEDEEVCNNDEDSVDSGTPLYNDEFFAGQYVHNVLNNDTDYKEYLIRICEGITICAGIYQLPSNGSETVRPFIRGTVFYFDTRLLLRYVGCGPKALVESTQELVELIQKNGGKICYYSLTKDEMLAAFNNAVSELKSNRFVSDFEMRHFAQKQKDNISVISAKKASLVEELASKGIHLRELENNPDSFDIQIGFNLNDLRQYMFNSVEWNHRTIDNDARVVWETHMIRRGNYSDYFGTNKRLSVFVTSNRALMSVISNYGNARKNVVGISNWNPTRLPVITDARLMCRLWSPCDQSNNTPLLYMASSVVAAQRFTPSYLKKICELANQLKSAVPAFAQLPLSSYFDDMVTEKLLTQTVGGSEELTLEQFASSMEDLIDLKAQEEAALRQQAEVIASQAQDELDKNVEQNIKDAIASYRNKIRFQEVLAWLALHSTNIIAIFLAVIGTLIGALFGWWMLIPAIGLVILEKILDLCSPKWLVKKVFVSIKGSCEKKIRKLLRAGEKNYEARIIKGVLAESKVFSQCQSLITESVT